MHGSAAAVTNTFSPVVTADFSFSESGPLSITSVTDGVTLQSDSGATYAPSSSVPDTTSTLGLLGLAMGGLVLLRRQLLKKGFPEISISNGFINAVEKNNL